LTNFYWGKLHLFFFRNDPPGQTCSQAIRKLTELTQNVSSGTVSLEFVSQIKDVQLKSIDTLQNLIRLDALDKMLNDSTDTDIPNFEQLVINASYTYTYVCVFVHSVSCIRSFSTDQ
jgi:hypothetical protein